MPKTRIPSPSRSQGSTHTPRRHKPRRSRSVCSPALSNASGRLTSIIDQFKDKDMESFSLSPLKSRWSVLTDNTDIEEPRRKSWWKNLNENSQDFLEVLEDNKATDSNNPVEDISDIEVISEENKNYCSLDLPESSDNESIQSIVLTQRKLFVPKENKQQKKFGQLIGARETLAKLHKTDATFHEKTITAGTKDLFKGTKKTKPVFSAALLNITANKTTVDKTTESIAAEPKIPVKNIFGNRPAKKRKNIFADFIASDSEHEISEIQVQTKQMMVKRTKNDKILEDDTAKSQKSDTKQSEKLTLGEDRINENDNNCKEYEEDQVNESQKSDITCKKNKDLNQPLKNIHRLVDSGENVNNLTTNIINEEEFTAGTKNLFHNIKGSNIVFSSTLLHASPNKTAADKTDGNLADTKITVKNIFGKRSPNKHRNIFADFLESESEHELSEIVPDKEESTAAETSHSNKEQTNKVDAIINIGTEQSGEKNQQDVVEQSENKDNEREIEKSIEDRFKQNQQQYAYERKYSSDNESVEDEEMKYEESDEDVREESTSKQEECCNSKHHREMHRNQEVYDTVHEIGDINSESIGNGQKKTNKSFIETIEIHKEMDNKKQSFVSKKRNIEVQDREDNGEKVNQESLIKSKGDEESENKEVTNKNAEIQNMFSSRKLDNHDIDTERRGSKFDKSIDMENKNRKNQTIYKSAELDKAIMTNNVSKQNDQNEVEIDRYEHVENEMIVNVTKENEIHNDENEEHHTDTEKNVIDDEIIVQVDNDENVVDDEQNELGDENEENEVCSDDNVMDDKINENRGDNNKNEVNNLENVQDDETNENEVDNDGNEENEEDNDECAEDDEIEADEVNNDENEVNEKSEENEVENGENILEIEENETDNAVNEVDNDDSTDIEVGNDKNVDSDVDDEENHDIEDIEVVNDEDVVTDLDDDENRDSEDMEVGNDENVDSDLDDDENRDSEDMEVGNDENVDSDLDDDENRDSEDNEVGNDENEDADVDDVENDENDDDEKNDDKVDDGKYVENENNEELKKIDDSRNKENAKAIEETSNVTHNTTSKYRKKMTSPEVVRHDVTKQQTSFIAKGRDTSIRKTKSMYKDLNIRPSLAPSRDSIGLSVGDSSAEGSGWDSHRTTRKTLRQTFGKDFTPRKSLRALVMEKSAKQTANMQTLQSETVLLPQANSTEYAQDTNSDVDMTMESDHEVSRRTRQTTLETYLQKIKQENIEKKLKMEQAIRNSLKTPATRDTLSLFKVPSKPPPRRPKPIGNKPKKQIKSILFDELPSEVIEDMKYKPPKRFQPSNASWITKRLYKFLESKLEPKYDYKARVRAEKLVETIYHFAKDLRRHDVAPVAAVDVLKHELARLEVVKTHFEFYEFFHEFMPREVRVKVVPDVVNKIPLPRHGVFADILRGNTVQG